MRTFKRILPVIICIICFAAVNGFLNYAVIPYQYPRMKVHTAEMQTFDDLVVGTSHFAAAIDPAAIKEETDRSSFNLAAGGQYPRDNYYLLLDVCRAHRPERVVLEYDPGYWISKDSFNRNARYLESVMEPSMVRLKYFADLCLGSDIRYVFMPWFLYRDEIKRFRENLAIKKSEAYASYGIEPFENSMQKCDENGFNAIDNLAQGDYSVPELAFTNENEASVKENQTYFEKTAQYCKENGIELVVVTTPVPENTREETISFYEQAHEMMQALSDRYGFSYLDYVCEKGTLSCNLPDELYQTYAYMDGEGHMHEKDARYFSGFLGRALKELDG